MLFITFGNFSALNCINSTFSFPFFHSFYNYRYFVISFLIVFNVTFPPFVFFVLLSLQWFILVILWSSSWLILSSCVIYLLLNLSIDFLVLLLYFLVFKFSVCSFYFQFFVKNFNLIFYFFKHIKNTCFKVCLKTRFSGSSMCLFRLSLISLGF